MKKLLIKDNIRRINIKVSENRHFVLKSIVSNTNLNTDIRFNAFKKLNVLISNLNSKVSLSNRCLFTKNKKRYHKLTKFSRHVFLKLIRSNSINGFLKSSW